ncbi:MAG: Shedu anti-phage system protein SduA domain-containing protein [Chloroflexota bacterium]
MGISQWNSNNDDIQEELLNESEEVYEERYKALLQNPKELSARYERGHLAAGGSLRNDSVKTHQQLQQQHIEAFTSLIRTAATEEELHKFIKQNRYLLTRKIHPAHHGQFCISKAKFGSQYIADFLIAGLDSAGLWWYGVELESPRKRMFTQNGDPTKELSHAIRQIEDWRGWLRQNIQYAQESYPGIDAELPCYVIMGSREVEVLAGDKLRSRTREVMKRDKPGLLLHHYEWLLEP